MGLMDFIRGQLIEIIEFNDNTRDTISWRFPDSDREIKRSAQLIVRESQVAQFIYLGQFGDTFGPGKHSLITDNIPVLSRIKGWKYGFESPFKADVYFVNTKAFTGNKWGTSNPVMLRDQDFGVIRLRAFGSYDFKVVEPKLFLKEVVGTDQDFHLDEFVDVMRSRLVSVFTDSLASAKVPALDVASRYGELGDALLPVVNPVVTAKYGIEISSFVIENVSAPPEVEAAIDKRSSMSAIGNLNEYVKYQMGKGMDSGTGDAASAAGSAAQIALGFGMAKQMMDSTMAQPTMAQTTPAQPAPPQSADLMGVPDVAKYLGVSEADVMSSITAGDLKAKKIGEQYRITKTAVDAFINS